MGTGSPSPIRPRQKGERNELDEDGAEEPSHQMEAYRNAWEPDNPDDQGVEGGPRDKDCDWEPGEEDQMGN